VQHYGWKYDYTARNITKELYIGHLPTWLDQLAHRLYDKKLTLQLSDQVIINEYQLGQGITAHIDCVPCFEEVIVSLSLKAPVMMDFTQNTYKETILLAPRSLLILSGDARYTWKHGIAGRKNDPGLGPRSRRVSLTFRNVIA
jgi:alkylated DNA repair dioxygenase AlkB